MIDLYIFDWSVLDEDIFQSNLFQFPIYNWTHILRIIGVNMDFLWHIPETI